MVWRAFSLVLPKFPSTKMLLTVRCSIARLETTVFGQWWTALINIEDIHVFPIDIDALLSQNHFVYQARAVRLLFRVLLSFTASEEGLSVFTRTCKTWWHDLTCVTLIVGARKRKTKAETVIWIPFDLVSFLKLFQPSLHFTHESPLYASLSLVVSWCYRYIIFTMGKEMSSVHSVIFKFLPCLFKKTQSGEETQEGSQYKKARKRWKREREQQQQFKILQKKERKFHFTAIHAHFFIIK